MNLGDAGRWGGRCGLIGGHKDEPGGVATVSYGVVRTAALMMTYRSKRE